MSKNFFTRGADQFGGKLSFIVYSLIERLKLLGAEKNEGIFRLSGSKSKISDLANELNEGPVSDWSKYTDINILSDTLKKYFRENSETCPLIPPHIYDQLLSVPSLFQNDQDAAITKVKDLMKKVSHPTYINIAYLMRYLQFVANASELNKMDSSNLARMFGPNIMSPPNKTDMKAMMANHDAQNNTTQILIDNADKIFEGFQLSECDILTDEDLKKISHSQIDACDIADSMVLREMRKDSLIPYVPGDLLNDPKFVRPI